MHPLQVAIIGFIFLGSVYASEESSLAVSCESGRVQIQCGQNCCHVNDAEIKAVGFNCLLTVEKELKRLDLVKFCDEELNPYDIRVKVDSDQKHSGVGQAVTITYSVLSMQRPFNSTWTQDGSALRTTHRMKTRTNSSTASLALRSGIQTVVRTEAAITINDVVLEDAGKLSHTFCNRARCVSTNFTLHVQGERVLPSATIPTPTAATPTVPAGEPVPPSATIPTPTAATPTAATPTVPAGDEQSQASLVPRIVLGIIVLFLLGIALLAHRR